MRFFISESLPQFLKLLSTASYMERKAMTKNEEGRLLDFDDLRDLKSFNRHIILFKHSNFKQAA